MKDELLKALKTAGHDRNDADVFLEEIELLINKGVDVNYQNEWGKTALMVCCDGARYSAKRNSALWIKAYFDIIELLIKNGADLDLEDCNGSTALTNGLIHGCYDYVELLIERGATLTDLTYKLLRNPKHERTRAFIEGRELKKMIEATEEENSPGL